MSNSEILGIVLDEDYIKLETAKLAREKGFNVRVCSAYVKYGRKYDLETYMVDSEGQDMGDYIDFQNWNLYADYYSAPTQTILRKWLLKIHGIELWFGQLDNPNKYHVEDIIRISDNTRLGGVYVGSETYEKALELGLLEALKLI